jgi:hypothetical protein
MGGIHADVTFEHKIFPLHNTFSVILRPDCLINRLHSQWLKRRRLVTESVFFGRDPIFFFLAQNAQFPAIVMNLNNFLTVRDGQKI